MAQIRDPWMQYGGVYRDVRDLGSRWAPSPKLNAAGPPFIPDTSIFPRDTNPQQIEGTRVCREQVPTIPRKRKSKVWNSLRRWLRKPEPPHTAQHLPTQPEEQDHESALSPRVAAHEWKAWGYYARPYLNGVQVVNSPIPRGQSLSFIDVNEVFNGLRSPGGGEYPDRWIPGLTHQAIPPRPTRWKEPSLMDPVPFPWECQLNPFLVHHRSGPSPLCWDISMSLFSAMYGEVMVTIPLTDPDLAQPATWPFLTHMHIDSLGDDTASHFPWPIMVYNPRGIKTGDILQAIYENFQEFVSQKEYDSWSSVRQRQVCSSYSMRRHHAPWIPLGDGVRRFDYLGHRAMFRGLEPNSETLGSWTMYVGLA